MSSYAKKESFFEKLSREVVDSGNLDDFFEKMAIFRAEISKESDLSGVYSFRQLCASLHEEQLSELKNFRGGTTSDVLDRFFVDLVITPHLMLKVALQAGDECLLENSRLVGITLAEKMRTRLETLDINIDDEMHLVVRSLRKLATVLAGTQFEHAFAEDLLSKPLGGQLMHSAVIKAYLAIDEREVIDHTPGDDLFPIDVDPMVAKGALDWLRKNEPKIAEILVEGDSSPAFTADVAALAQKKGFTSLAWMIRLRQKHYKPDEILKNVIDYGTHPDPRMIELEEAKGPSSSTKSLLDSNAALIAYCLVHDVDSSVLTASRNLKFAQRAALKAIASLGLEPSSARNDSVREIADVIIESAVDHESVKWLSELKCLGGVLKASRKYQGLRLESDLGM